MKSVVSVKGQTVIPKEVRKALGIETGAILHWSLKDGSVEVSRLPDDPIRAMKGALKHLKYSTRDLLEERYSEREREERQVEKLLERWRSTR
jgi:AbrB family looped-hinge helix DNA binding protein